MLTEFKFTENEAKAAKEFEEKHIGCVRKNPTAIGGHITYSFTPTGIGLGVTVKCNLCGEELDITDYGCW